MQSTSPIETITAWNSIQVAGSDRVTFLQGQLTHDISLLKPETAMLSGWCSPKGRLLCVCWLIDWQDAIWLILPAELADAVSSRLQMFVMRSDVTIKANALPVTPIHRSQMQIIKDVSLEKTSLNDCIYNKNLYYIQPSLTPELGLLIGVTEAIEPAPDDWQRSMVTAGIPIIRAATQEEFVPQMLNLDLLDGISFTKGCYVGQEIVARTHNLGRIKRRMYGFSYTGRSKVTAGQPVVSAGKTVGMVVDSAQDDANTLLTAVIRIDNLADTLFLEGDEISALQSRELSYSVPTNLDGKPG